MEGTQTSAAVEDFSGGITDYVLDARPNQSADLNNFLINPNRKPETAPGSQIYDSLMYQVPDGNVRISSLYAAATPELFITSARKIWVPNTSAFLELTGPTTNPAFSASATTDPIAWAEWNEHVLATSTGFASPIKMFKDGSNVWQTRTAGLPNLASTPTCTLTAAGVNNYVYAFCYYISYTVGTTTFEDYGPTTLVSVTASAAPNVNQINIAAVPTLANGATLNYDTTNVKTKVYRTISGGTVFYLVGTINNGTATLVDTMSDTTLQTQDQLYTNGGVLDNDPPPLCKYVTVVNNTAYYAHVKVGSQIFKNRVRQSVPEDVDSCPAELIIDVLDEITGISSYNDNPLVFTKNHVFRLNGQYSELGQGQVTYEDITKTIGCMSHNSIVQTRLGVFWAGNDGFYWTDGFQYKKISDSINNRYKKIVSTAARQVRIHGTFDKKDNRVIWAVSYEDSSSDNDTFFILDMRWGINEMSTFTTRNNGSSFAPTAITFYNGQLIRGDTRGYIFKHDSQYTTDPKINTSKIPSLWTTKAIIPLYTSFVSNLGVPNARKWVPKMLLTLENLSNASVQINSVNDNTSSVVPLKEIRYRGNYLWGDANPVWGADTPNWSFFNLIEEMRRFPAKYLRASYKQIQITTAYTIIYNSDTQATANVDSGAKTASITGGLTWPTEIEDYYISFENDGYVKDYLITDVSGATITFLDPLSGTITANQKWIIRGYPKGELLNILSFVVYFSVIGSDSFKTWRSEQDSTGENA